MSLPENLPITIPEELEEEFMNALTNCGEGSVNNLSDFFGKTYKCQKGMSEVLRKILAANSDLFKTGNTKRSKIKSLERIATMITFMLLCDEMVINVLQQQISDLDSRVSALENPGG